MERRLAAVMIADVAVEGEDIHGGRRHHRGAAAKQLAADKSSIVIAGTAYDHAKGKVAVGFASLGELRVRSDMAARPGDA